MATPPDTKSFVIDDIDVDDTDVDIFVHTNNDDNALSYDNADTMNDRHTFMGDGFRNDMCHLSNDFGMVDEPKDRAPAASTTDSPLPTKSKIASPTDPDS